MKFLFLFSIEKYRNFKIVFSWLAVKLVETQI